MNFNLVEMYNGLLRFKQGGLGAGVTNLILQKWLAFNGGNPVELLLEVVG